jgi:hypothetical protein
MDKSQAVRHDPFSANQGQSDAEFRHIFFLDEAITFRWANDWQDNTIDFRLISAMQVLSAILAFSRKVSKVF